METMIISFTSTTLSALLSFFFLCISLPSLTFSYDNLMESYERLQLTSALGPESLAFDCRGEGPNTGLSDGVIFKWQGHAHVWTEFAQTSQHIVILGQRNFLPASLKYGNGPESLAFDCNGQGPYTGISDGRIMKWEGPNTGWIEFAVTSPNRNRAMCDGNVNPALESGCGRALGLEFNKVTCDLYIADAYKGLVRVGRNGGVAIPLVSSAEGVPFRFTNSLDINQENGDVYFTDSSLRFQRWENLRVVQTGDSTGRFMRYSPITGQVTVLLRDLQYANGVALSRDNTFVLFTETSGSRVLRYWIKGSKTGITELFAQVPGAPDNIKRSSEGEFWVALNNGRTTPSYTYETIALRLDNEGRVLEALPNNGLMESVSEVAEFNGYLWVGSVAMPYATVAQV